MKKQLTWSIRFTTLLLCLFSVLCIRAQQASNVKGTVLDSNNEPLIGATVSVKGNPSHGSITDIDGNFNASGSKFPRNASCILCRVFDSGNTSSRSLELSDKNERRRSNFR